MCFLVCVCRVSKKAEREEEAKDVQDGKFGMDICVHLELRDYLVVVIKEGAQDSVGTAFTVFGDWEITQKGEGNKFFTNRQVKGEKVTQSSVLEVNSALESVHTMYTMNFMKSVL